MTERVQRADSLLRQLVCPWRVQPRVFRHALQAFDAVLGAGGWGRLVWLLVGIVVFWHLYAPVHELLHVLACRATGGTVEALALKPRYGAHLLKQVFPFIVPESDYAGQLTGFSVPNSWAYAVVDLAPYLLSLFGVACLETARRRRAWPWFSVGAILAFVPWMVIPGDYYEAASLLFTRVGEALNPAWPEGVLLSDDVFALLERLSTEGRLTALSVTLVALGLVAAVYLVMVTMVLQVQVARWIHGPSFLSLPPKERFSASTIP